MTFNGELEKLREITDKLTENGYLIDRAAQWEFAFDAVPDYVFIINPKSEIMYVNRALIKSLGITKIETLGKHCWRALCCPSENGSICDNSQLEESLKIKEVRIDNGLSGWFHFTRTPIYNEEDKFLGAVVVLRDITERKQTEFEMSG